MSDGQHLLSCCGNTYRRIGNASGPTRASAKCSPHHCARNTSSTRRRNCCRSPTFSSRSRNRVAVSIAVPAAASAPTGLGKSRRPGPAIAKAARSTSARGTLRPCSQLTIWDLYTRTPIVSLSRSAKACVERSPRIALIVSATRPEYRFRDGRAPTGLKTITSEPTLMCLPHASSWVVNKTCGKPPD
jgi:hypothetical protein